MPSASTDHVTAEAHKARVKAGGVKVLSNMDLKALNERMQLEQTHRNLSGQAPSKFEKGHGHVKKILSTAKTLSDIYNTVQSPAGKALKKAVTK
jgi:predicted ATPase with chaperone activity